MRVTASTAALILAFTSTALATNVPEPAATAAPAMIQATPAIVVAAEAAEPEVLSKRFYRGNRATYGRWEGGFTRLVGAKRDVDGTTDKHHAPVEITNGHVFHSKPRHGQILHDTMPAKREARIGMIESSHTEEGKSGAEESGMGPGGRHDPGHRGHYLVRDVKDHHGEHTGKKAEHHQMWAGVKNGTGKAMHNGTHHNGTEHAHKYNHTLFEEYKKDHKS